MARTTKVCLATLPSDRGNDNNWTASREKWFFGVISPKNIVLCLETVGTLDLDDQSLGSRGREHLARSSVRPSTTRLSEVCVVFVLLTPDS